VAAKPYVFVSHASEDKVPRVRPLAEALLLQDLSLWLDRPGHGESHFGFDESFIRQHSILGLVDGLDYREQIKQAIRHAGAVLVCMSSALSAQRQVLIQELTLASFLNKLVACIVDDVPYDAIPRDLGLMDAACLQADRLDTASLAAAVILVRENNGSPNALPDHLKRQWDISAKIANELRQLCRISGPRSPVREEAEAVHAALRRVPIGPRVEYYEVSPEIVALLADLYSEPSQATALVDIAMAIREECNCERFTPRQITVPHGERLSMGQISAEEYWSDLLAKAGAKSRRTLAAILLTPGAFGWKSLLGSGEGSVPSTTESVIREYLNWLEHPPRESAGA
jgi:hypothetical protein